MSVLHRIRVAAVGSKTDMIRLNRVLLTNLKVLEEPDDRPPFTLRELKEQVEAEVQWQTGDGSGFLYEMIGRRHYGEALDGSRYELIQMDRDLWTALFTYESGFRLQTDDWLQLHLQCEKLPMFILHATNDFSLDKGYVCISNGEVREEWDRMAETWLWLVEEYCTGMDPESAVRHLERLEKVMVREDWNQTVEQLLESCEENLQEVMRARDLIDTDKYAQAEEAGDWVRLYEMQKLLADAQLWDIRRSTIYLACLKQDREAWQEAHGPEPEEEEKEELSE